MTNNIDEIRQVLDQLRADFEAGKITGLAGIAHYGHETTMKFGCGSCVEHAERTLDDLRALEAQFRPEREANGERRSGLG